MSRNGVAAIWSHDNDDAPLGRQTRARRALLPEEKAGKERERKDKEPRVKQLRVWVGGGGGVVEPKVGRKG